jgi:hypothetical protein
MAPPASNSKSFPVIPVLLAAVAGAILIAVIFYFSHSTPAPVPEAPPTPEAKTYVHNLKLSNVSVKAAENLMQQRVVEVDGDLTNTGPRSLETVEVYCYFYGVHGRELARERVPMVGQAGTPLKPAETRAFRLPFDNLPDGWNQAVPGMVIARIVFAK